MSDIVRIYSDNRITIAKIQSVLLEAEIASFIKDDFQSGNMAGFSGGIPSIVDLFVDSQNVSRASEIIQSYLQEFNS
jgi:hypothetical protein